MTTGISEVHSSNDSSNTLTPPLGNSTGKIPVMQPNVGVTSGTDPNVEPRTSFRSIVARWHETRWASDLKRALKLLVRMILLFGPMTMARRDECDQISLFVIDLGNGRALKENSFDP